MQKESKRNLSRLFWDVNIPEEKLVSVLNGTIEPTPYLNASHIYSRLLMSTDWYEFLSLVPKSKWKEAVSEDVIAKLPTADLKERYRYARKFL